MRPKTLEGRQTVALVGQLGSICGVVAFVLTVNPWYLIPFGVGLLANTLICLAWITTQTGDKS